ncbi:MAG: phosphate ABC transporter permease PstA [Desulfohalobiaceae bacterium]|nr:phosphate ABC transporter permease PstA [Desulfohalobiaceae bacterium]
MDPNSLKRTRMRYRSERRFKLYCAMALVLAGVFLVIFFADIISKGYPAFWQAQIKVDVSYTQDVKELPFLAVGEDVSELISRSWFRQLPRKLNEHPELIGTTRSKWVLADGAVDQYLKDKPNGLDKEQKNLVDRLRNQDRTKLAFNTYFFTQGDSKLPESSGIFSAAVGTVYVMIVTMAFSLPTGVLTAIYLEEFARDNWLTRAIEVNINNLAAIPSILYGLLGLAIFINYVGIPRSSALAGGLTLGLMSLPVIIISSRAALRAVPDSIREAAFGVGASRWQVVSHHVLPMSLPGILTGSIIALAQAMGETAPLLLVGMMAFIPEAPSGFTDAATVMPAQIYTWSSAALRPYAERTAAAILVLLAVLILLNLTAVFLRKRYERTW